MKRIFLGMIVFMVIALGTFAYGGKLVSEADTVHAEYQTVKTKNYKITESKKRFYKKLTAGEQLQLEISYKGKKVDASKLLFSSTKENVASVNENGLITANSNGVAVIKVTNKKKNAGVSIFVTVADVSVRTLFIGDSRTLDMFTSKPGKHYGRVHNGMVVFALDGATARDMTNILNRVDLGDYDRIVSWMGANDYGHFEHYQNYYDKLLKKHKKLILCTVGQSNDDCLPERDSVYFGNCVISSFNKKLKQYAKQHKLTVINVSKAVSKYTTIDGADGLHYSPKPNKKLWKYFVKQIQTK